MSRSYKHTPYGGQRNSRGMKRIANHRVRQALKNHDLSLSPADYKRLTCPWDICDWYWIDTPSFERHYQRQLSRWKFLHDTWRWGYYPGDFPPTREEAWIEYCRDYRWK